MIECVLESRTATYIEAGGTGAATSFALSFRQHSIYIFYFLLFDLSPWGLNITAQSSRNFLQDHIRSFHVSWHSIVYNFDDSRSLTEFHESWKIGNNESSLIRFLY